jgi:general secretion pathway protein H
MNPNKGFTLIEILIVIVIIGITVGFALIAFGDFGGSKRILFAAEQLENTLKLAQQQAILETSTLGLRIDNTSYQVLKFKDDSWSTISDKGIFKIYYFPPKTTIILKTLIKTSQGNPSIVINSSGDMTPFTLSFGVNNEDIITVLKGTHDGNITLNKVPTQ